MTEEIPSFDQLPPPEPENSHKLTMPEKFRIFGSLAILAVGQVFVAKGVVDGNIGEVFEADAVAVPIALGLAMSVPEMRRRMPIVGRKIINYLQEPISGPRQQR